MIYPPSYGGNATLFHSWSRHSIVRRNGSAVLLWDRFPCWAPRQKRQLVIANCTGTIQTEIATTAAPGTVSGLPRTRLRYINASIEAAGPPIPTTFMDYTRSSGLDQPLRPS